LFDLPLLPWETVDSNQLFIRAPRADEAWSQRFESILGAATCDYAITLTGAVVSDANKEWNSPIVLIIVLSQDDPCFDFDRLSETVKRVQSILLYVPERRVLGISDRIAVRIIAMNTTSDY